MKVLTDLELNIKNSLFRLNLLEVEKKELSEYPEYYSLVEIKDRLIEIDKLIELEIIEYDNLQLASIV